MREIRCFLKLFDSDVVKGDGEMYEMILLLFGQRWPCHRVIGQNMEVTSGDRQGGSKVLEDGSCMLHSLLCVP